MTYFPFFEYYLRTIALCAVFLPLNVVAESTVQYRVIDLGAVSGSEGITQGQAINDAGQAIANSLAGDGSFLWENGVITELEGPQGENSQTYALAINNLGQVVGGTENSALLWDKGTRTDLGTLPNYDGCGAQSINDAGLIVGACAMNTQPSLLVGYIWDSGIMTKISLGLGETGFFPTSVNNNGEVVGQVFGLGNQGIYGAIWQGGIVTPLSFSPTYNGDNGWVGTSGGYWDGSQLVDLQSQGVRNVFGINSRGEMVGESTGLPEAIIWDLENGVRKLANLIDPNDPLRDSILRLQEAIDINNRGQIMIMNGLLKSDESPFFTTHALLLTPMEKTSPHPRKIPVPFIALVLLSLVAIGAVLRISSGI